MEQPSASDWVAIIQQLGPGTFVLLFLVGLVAWMARPLIASAPSPARDIGKLEGLVEGLKDRLDALETRISDLEKER
jgi:cell division protein FtsB